MSQKRFDLYVPISDDGRTTFSEVSDILEHLATLYAWHPDCYGFLVTRAHEARMIDTIYEKEELDGEPPHSRGACNGGCEFHLKT